MEEDVLLNQELQQVQSLIIFSLLILEQLCT